MNHSTDIHSPDNTDDVSSVPSGRQDRRNLLWLSLHVLLYPVFRLWIRTSVLHPQRLEPGQGGILLMNHQSYLDPMLAAVRLTRPVSYLARDSLFRVPVIGFILKRCYVIAISRTAFRGSSVRMALQRLEEGFLIALFPEGTRTSGPPEAFRPGFLSITRRTDLPVYPVAIVGADKVMPRGAWFPRPGKITVVYGKPLTLEEQQQLNELKDREAAEMIRQKVELLYAEAAAGPVSST